jgi:hypothetical protein
MMHVLNVWKAYFIAIVVGIWSIAGSLKMAMFELFRYDSSCSSIVMLVRRSSSSCRMMRRYWDIGWVMQIFVGILIFMEGPSIILLQIAGSVFVGWRWWLTLLGGGWWYSCCWKAVVSTFMLHTNGAINGTLIVGWGLHGDLSFLWKM